MPNYRTDLEWLRLHHPEEYTRIPVDVLVSPQMHSSVLKPGEPSGTADPDAYNWMIFRLYTIGDDPGEKEITQVELSIPRPAPDPDPDCLCSMHTLAVSRPLCPCQQSEPASGTGIR